MSKVVIQQSTCVIIILITIKKNHKTAYRQSTLAKMKDKIIQTKWRLKTKFGFRGKKSHEVIIQVKWSFRFACC